LPNCLQTHAWNVPLGGFVELISEAATYEREAEIHGEDDPAAHVWEVVRGAVRSLKTMADGRRQIVAFHFLGDLFGLVSSERHLFTAEAMCETHVLRIARSKFDRARRENLELAQHFEGMAIRAVQHAQELSVLLGRMTATERVAAFLLDMERRIGAGGRIILPMRRRDIADYLGITLETVSRVLSQFTRLGAISKNDRVVMLRRRELLLKARGA
jgi:CRP-like cAMP-binding protein